MSGSVALNDEAGEINMSDISSRILERYGFSTLLAAAILWFARTDIVVPMVEAHMEFLKTLTQTQKEIGQTVHDQTVIMQQIQKDAAEWRRSVSGGIESSR